jgi:hypothetical protein
MTRPISMMLFPWFPMIGFLLGNLPLPARVLPDSSFFPLAIGNQWIYSTADGLSADTETVADTQRVNGRLYYGFSRNSSSAPYLWFRKDSDKVYIADSITVPEDTTDIREFLMYNFSARPWPAESWKVGLTQFPLDCDYGGNIALERIADSVVTPAGLFRNCPVFLHQPKCRDAGISGEFFAAGVGRIQINRVTFSGGFNFYLTHSTLITPVAGEDHSSALGSYSLAQNYPNPFNSTTTIVFQIQRESDVTLEIYDLAGQRIETLLKSELNAGHYTVSWNAINRPSGIYFCTLRAGNFSRSIKLLLIR